jgi:hypothetical protein
VNLEMSLGVITDVRPHPTRPLEVEFDFGDGTITDWLMCSVEAWSVLGITDLQDAVKLGQGIECLVAQIGYSSTGNEAGAGGVPDRRANSARHAPKTRA